MTWRDFSPDLNIGSVSLMEIVPGKVRSVSKEFTIFVRHRHFVMTKL